MKKVEDVLNQATKTQNYDNLNFNRIAALTLAIKTLEETRNAYLIATAPIIAKNKTTGEQKRGFELYCSFFMNDILYYIQINENPFLDSFVTMNTGTTMTYADRNIINAFLDNATTSHENEKTIENLSKKIIDGINAATTTNNAQSIEGHGDIRLVRRDHSVEIIKNLAEAVYRQHRRNEYANAKNKLQKFHY